MKKLRYIIPVMVLLVLSSMMAYATGISLNIPKSTEGPHSILTWGESGTYIFEFDGLDPNQVIACTEKTEDCEWKARLKVNGVDHWNGKLFEKVGEVAKKNHITSEVKDLGGGKAQVIYTATPPEDNFAGTPYTTWKWHGIEYQTWLMSAIFTKGNALQQIGGSVAMVVIEDMEKVNEFLTDMTETAEGGVLHLNYKLNDPEKGVLTLTNQVYDYTCTTYKDNWDTFKNGELTLAKESLEDLDALRAEQATDYQDYTIEDAKGIQGKINLASDRYTNAVNIYKDDFNGCPCVEGCQ